MMIKRLPGSNRTAFISAAGAFVALFAFFAFALHSPGKLYLEVANDNDDEGQIYIDSGHGYAPDKAIVVSLMADGELHEYAVDINTSLPTAIRFDPGHGIGNVRLGQIKFDSLLYARSVSCDELRLLHAVERRSAADSVCDLRAIAADPYVDFPVAFESSLSSLRIKWLKIFEGLAFALTTFLLLFVVSQVRDRAAISQDSWLTNARALRWYAILGLGFVSFVFLNLHVSSIGEWKKFVPSDVPSGVLIGESRSIRSDEWLVQTPFYASQTANKFDVDNPSLGANGVTLTATVPVQGLYGYAQPRFWGFYLLGFDKGLSWLYAWRVFGLLFATFVLCALISKGDFWLALMGSVWITLSPFMQWWFTTNLPDMVIGVAGGIVAFYLMLSVTSVRALIGASIILFFSGITFITALYPAYLVPLFHLAIFVLAGLFFRDKLYRTFLINWMTRVFFLTAPVLAVIWISLDWLREASLPISLLQESVYPGRRLSLGGGVPFAWLFSGFFGLFLSADTFPRVMGNVCNASNFLLMFPLAWMVMIIRYRQSGRIDPLNLSLSLYIGFVMVWILVGYPEWLAVNSGMSMSPPIRTLLGIGLGSILLLISVASSTISNAVPVSGTTGAKSTGVLLVAFVIAFAIISYWLSIDYPDFVTWQRAGILVPLLAGWALAFMKGKRLWLVTLTGLLVSNGLIANPVAYGAFPLRNTELVAALKEEGKQNNPKWLAFSNLLIPQYLKAQGAMVWNGVRFISDPAEMRVLDPEERYRDVWYRYAHFIVEAAAPGSSPVFELKQADVVLLTIDVCSDSVRGLGVNRFAFMAKPDPDQTSCLVPLRSGPVAGFWLYKRLESQPILEITNSLKNE